VRRVARLLACLSISLLAACGARRGESGHAPSPDDPNLLAASEIGNYAHAHLAIQSLRPGWLRTRAAGGLQASGEVWVYRDGMRFGGVDRLSSINTVEIESIRYYDGITASQRWG
jgi:hypothetical protein